MFAVKGSQFITHSKKLKDPEVALANFFASGILCLRETLGPILWQLPEMRFDPGRLEAFLELLPRDTHELAALAQGHDHRLEGRAHTEPDKKRRVHHAVELRHAAFMTEDVVRTFRRHKVPLVFSHAGRAWRYVEELTGGFVYVRLHGAPHCYRSGYGPKTLDRWAERIRAWSRGAEPADAARITDRAPPRRSSRDVFVYFDNDQLAYAPRDAKRLMQKLGVHWEPDAGA
jgi:uncharacterized protein YecE (DUF72 family)